MTGYAFHPAARFDLDEIWEYIRTDNLDAADRTVAEILSAIRALVPFPGQGHPRPREYLIAYAPDEKPLWVVAIMHGRRNPRLIAAILRSRNDRMVSS